jgi:hypothetical protein
MTVLHAPDAPTILPGDPRYDHFALRGDKRFAGHPECIRVVSSTEQVVSAVQEALRDGKRIAARSGGHCLEGFVADPAVQVVTDLSMMTGVGFDEVRGAFEIEAGATVGDAYRQLFLQWGVTIPAGVAPSVGIGGHILGGAFGYLCRQYGLASDYLLGVEVVVVDDSGSARAVTATRDEADQNHDLWWAHTGGGGGNFGIVTRYWLRSPDVEGGDPRQLLPRAPESVLSFKAVWDWNATDEAAFLRLLQNHGRWCEEHSAPGSRFASLYSVLSLFRKQHGTFELTGLVTAGAASEQLLAEHLAAINEGVAAPHSCETQTRSWLSHALDWPAEGPIYKLKDASLRRRLTDAQIRTVYLHLTRDDCDLPGGMLGMATYGGQVNALAPDATATWQRDTTIRLSCTAGWQSADEEARNIAWVRQLYRDLFADTGGVPVPNQQTAGAIINHADIDLADPELNRSGVPWHALYYGDNYARLQRIKARWDPLNVFRHLLSIEPSV